MQTDPSARPIVVCLCGSTKFYQAFMQANANETLKGKIVLTVGFFMHVARDLGIGPAMISADEKKMLDRLHLAKIDLADEVLILNVNDYIGTSTRREAWYALQQGKRLRLLEVSQYSLTDIRGWFVDKADWEAAAHTAAA